MLKLQMKLTVYIMLLLFTGCSKDNEVASRATIINSVGMEMIYIPSGFWVSKYETTQEQFTQIMGFNPSSEPMAGKYPVENMTKEDAEKFCIKLTNYDRIRGKIPQGYSYQLPSFKEWKKYIADASLDKSITFAGKYKNISDDRGLYDVSLVRICEVGSGEVNRLGIYDLRGNVMELSRDILSAPDYDLYKVFGACYKTSRDEYLNINNICYTKERRLDTGFRCVLREELQVNDVQQTELHNAIISGDMQNFLALLERFPEMINKTNIYGETPIHLAILNNQEEMVKQLISKNADINIKTNDGAYPLHYACSLGNSEILLLLVNKSTTLPEDTFMGMSCMHLGIRTWNTEFVKTLVASGFKDDKAWDLGYKDQYDQPVMQGTALSVALDYKRYDIAIELLKGDIDFNIADKFGDNVFHTCVRDGWAEGVKIMLDKGADINSKNREGHTALYYSKLHGNIEITQLIEDRLRK